MEPMQRRMAASFAVTAVTVLTAVTVACGGSGGRPSDGSDADGGSVTPTTAFVQPEFHGALSAPVLAAFDQAVGERFRFDKASLGIADLATGDVRLDDRLSFAKDQGMLGFFRADFPAGGGEELWGLTTQVFTSLDGPRAVWAEFGNYEAVSIDDAELVDRAEAAYATGREGGLFVDTYLFEDGTRSYAMRGSLVDANTLHHVVGLVDVPVGEAFDGFAALRAALDAIDGVHRRAYEQALADAVTTKTG